MTVSSDLGLLFKLLSFKVANYFCYAAEQKSEQLTPELNTYFMSPDMTLNACFMSFENGRLITSVCFCA